MGKILIEDIAPQVQVPASAPVPAPIEIPKSPSSKNFRPEKPSDMYQIGSVVVMLMITIALLVFAGQIFIKVNPNSTADNQFLSAGSECGKTMSTLGGQIFGNAESFSDTVITANLRDYNVVSMSDSEYLISTSCLGDATLTFKKEGFVPLHKKIVLRAGQNTLDAQLAPETPFEKIDFKKDSNVSQDGASLAIPASSLVKLSDGTPAGSANVSLTRFDSSDPVDLAFFPGDFTGERTDGSVVSFQSFGFVKVQVEDDSGEKLDLKDGSKAQLISEIADAQKDTAPDTIPLWFFDENSNTWTERGTGKKECDSDGKCYYKGTIDKIASFWNWDNPFSRTVKIIIGKITFNPCLAQNGGRGADPTKKPKYNLTMDDFLNILKEFESQYKKDTGNDLSANDFFKYLTKKQYDYVGDSGLTWVTHHDLGGFKDSETYRTLDRVNTEISSLPSTGYRSFGTRMESMVYYRDYVFSMGHLAAGITSLNMTQWSQEPYDYALGLLGLDKYNAQNINGDRIARDLKDALIASKILDYMGFGMTPSEFFEKYFDNAYNDYLKYGDFRDKCDESPSSPATGKFILDYSREAEGRSFIYGIDAGTRLVHYQISDNIYLEESDILDASFGKIAVFLSFLEKDSSGYKLFSDDGVAYVDPSAISSTGNGFTVSGFKDLMEFTEKIGERYMLTKRIKGDSIFNTENDYTYSDGRLSEIRSKSTISSLADWNRQFYYENGFLKKATVLSAAGTTELAFTYVDGSISKVETMENGKIILSQSIAIDDSKTIISSSNAVSTYAKENGSVKSITLSSPDGSNSATVTVNYTPSNDSAVLASDAGNIVCVSGYCGNDYGENAVEYISPSFSLLTSSTGYSSSSTMGLDDLNQGYVVFLDRSTNSTASVSLSVDGMVLGTKTYGPSMVAAPADSMTIPLEYFGGGETVLMSNCNTVAYDLGKFYDCTNSFSMLFGLDPLRQLEFIRANSSISNDTKAALLSKFADDYSYFDACFFSAEKSIYTGASCIKSLDSKKLAEKSLLIKRMNSTSSSDLEKAFIYRSLALYYDNNIFCEAISSTLESARASCFNDLSVKPVCGIANLNYCTSDSNCVVAGGFWWDSKCNYSSQPICATANLNLCIDDANCAAASGYWWGDKCNQDPEGVVAVCDSAHLNLCTSDANCTAIGGYWWNNTCNASAQPPACSLERVDLCTTESDCSGAGAFWWMNSCNSETQPSQYMINMYNLIMLQSTQQNNFNCDYDSNRSSPFYDSAGDSYIKITEGVTLGIVKVAGTMDKCANGGATTTFQKDGNKIIPCSTGVDLASDECVLFKKTVFDSPSGYTQSYMSRSDSYGPSGTNYIYAQNKLDFVASDGKIWLMAAVNSINNYFILDSSGTFEKQSSLDINYPFTNMGKVIPTTKGHFWAITSSPFTKMYTTGYMDVTPHYTCAGEMGPMVQTSSWSGSFNERGTVSQAEGVGISILAIDSFGNIAGKLRTKGYCTQRYDWTCCWYSSYNSSVGSWDLDPNAMTRTMIDESTGNLWVEYSGQKLIEYSKDSQDANVPVSQASIKYIKKAAGLP